MLKLSIISTYSFTATLSAAFVGNGVLVLFDGVFNAVEITDWPLLSIYHLITFIQRWHSIGKA
jgi:hypothetical protein